MSELPLTAIDARAWPKIDLHRHLEGSIRPATILDLYRKNYARYMDVSLESFLPTVQATGNERTLFDFLEIFDRFMPAIKTEEDLTRITLEAIEDAARDGIVYLELRYSPHFIAGLTGLDAEQATRAVVEAKEAAERRCWTRVELLLIMPQSGGAEAGAHTVDLALRFRDRGVRGVDIAGDMRKFGLDLYGPIMARAAAEGLGITVHAGETTPAETVATAVRELHATRVGHGIRAIDDEAVLDLLRKRGIVLEISVTSNVQTRVASSVREHPIRRLIEEGVRVTVNTDDPSVSAITLSDEYALLARELGFDYERFRQLNQYAIDAAFTTAERRAAVRALLADVPFGQAPSRSV